MRSVFIWHTATNEAQRPVPRSIFHLLSLDLHKQRDELLTRTVTYAYSVPAFRNQQARSVGYRGRERGETRLIGTSEI